MIGSYFTSTIAVLAASFMLLSGCSFKSQEPLSMTAPFVETSTFSDELFELGRMSVIYNAPLTKVQSSMVLDNTGAWRPLATGAEIQRDITEIVKSTLNSIGGRVVFIEYNPMYISNQVSTGYSNFQHKIIPDVVLTGGITGFDRALETVSSGIDASADLQFQDLQNDNSDIILPPSENVSASYDSSKKTGLAKITLDFNMKDFRTLAGIPYMTSTQSMLVHKDVQNSGFAITLFGPTFGLNGSVKRVQGRHEAVRVLVQSSLIHLLGRHMTLPYWRLLDGVTPDKIVLNRIRTSFRILPEMDRIVKVQTWLIIHGYQSNLNGNLDPSTVKALSDYTAKNNLVFSADKPSINYDLYESLYINLPLDDKALGRRIALTRILSQAAVKDRNAKPAS